MGRTNSLGGLIGRRTTGRALLALAAGAALAAGCSPGVGKYDVKVSVAPELRNSSLDLDIVAVDAVTKGNWSGQRTDDYFSGTSPTRANARAGGEVFTMEFRPGGPQTQTLEAKNPIWTTKWGKRPELFFIANTPGATDAQRTQTIPLATDRWDSRTIEVVIEPKRINVVTPMKAPK